MSIENEGALKLVTAILGEEDGRRIAAMLTPMLPAGHQDRLGVTRAQMAAAMNMLLFAGLLERVPSAAS